MRRVLATAATAATLLLAFGCGGKSYERRLEYTLGEMKYRQRLDANLEPPEPKGKLTDTLIYLRPPKGVKPSKEFLLTVLEPGKFDVAESFTEPDKENLHVLARIKKPKPAPGAKKAPPTPADTATRGEFNTDVFAILNSVYGVEIDASKAKEEPKRNNKFKHVTFTANGKDVQVYLYGNKTAPYEVALIFEYPKSEQATLASKIELCLGSFATGERARRAFSGSGTEEESAEAAAPSGVF